MASNDPSIPTVPSFSQHHFATLVSSFPTPVLEQLSKLANYLSDDESETLG